MSWVTTKRQTRNYFIGASRVVSRQREVSAEFKSLRTKSFNNIAGNLNIGMYWMDSITTTIY